MRKLDWRAGLAAGLLAVTTSLPMQAADTVYKWVGEDGTTHYGTRPPNGVDSTAIKPKTGHSEPVDYSHLSGTEEQEQTDRDESSAEEEASTKDPERCEAARKNKEILGRGGRVREATDDGSFRYLSEEEKAKRLEDAQKAIDESC
ncbi:DUF4124 domain-containing protein [Gilvimarinus algae]|uniref:DUF4124 domain-containing protein n=1 Tax=Gilvimarinus algae TaxID=3058037 RepID=A0ABT8T9J4_9GAMM|nr:DUF4124 domain-containing protein [Gilvimarinus sp. SDUM040014]MDO3380806.1 DUF4124 domain-containing protein [Gilvimarinus sp. SDUM040014]